MAAPFLATLLFRIQDGSPALIAVEMLALATVLLLLRYKALAAGLVIGLIAHYLFLWYLLRTW